MKMGVELLFVNTFTTNTATQLLLLLIKPNFRLCYYAIVQYKPYNEQCHLLN